MTTETKVTHTPGPWELFDADSDTPADGYRILGANFPQDGVDSIVADIIRVGSESKFKTDAHLIAAAPDMLEALEELFKFATEFAPLFTVTPNGRFDKALKAADAAIAKAKGGAA